MTKKTDYVAAPSGMSGLYVEPWSKGEIYAVAADWAQASSPVLVYGKDGWTSDECGRQVADFRHNDRAALEAVIRSAIEMGGEEPDDDEVAGILDDATELMDADLAEMCEMLDRHGDRFSGNHTPDSAQDWRDNDFDADAANEWCEIGCWDAGVAAELRDAGLTAQQASDAAERLTEGLEDAAETYTDGDPIYSVCNGDTDAQEIIDAANVEE